ncbi:MAG: helix-turn-helix domain-containing protein, partial [Candidatus Taylorbacteria bacterium]|nr:helix-turn-helix domain-containing protein [Candidatus Taylorbacteria bacterium]
IKNVTKFFPHNEEVNRINAEELERLPNKSKSFVMTGRGKANLVEQLKRGCLSPENLELKKGAVVMFTKNNSQRGFVNGTIGTVIGFDQYEDENYPIVKTRQGRQLTVKPMEWTIEENGEAVAKIEQVPLRLAWAMTIHKSQGITLDEAFMDLDGAFVEGQGYVALSRVKTLDGLHLAGYNDKALAVHPTVLRHDDAFRQLSGEIESAHANLSKDQLAQFHDNFIATLGGRIRPEKEAQDAEFVKFNKSGSSFYRGNYQENRLDQTFNLISAGKTIAEVSQICGRTEETIIKHLEDLKASGQLAIDKVMHLKTEVGDDAMNEIHDTFNKLGIERLKPIYDYFEGRHSYKSIRLARLLLKAS